MTDNKYDTIIVGGGIAGLTAAAYSVRNGKKTILFEKNNECGGLVNSFKRNGFHFDAGVRALEDAGVIFPMLKDLGIEMEVVNSPVSLGIEDKIISIETIENLNDYRHLLCDIFPESESEIDALLKVIRRIMKHMEVLYGVENPVFKDLKKDKQFLFKRLLPWLPKFMMTVGKINKMNMPVEEYLDSIISNPSLKDMIAQHFFKNTPTFFALSYFSLYLDYFYPKGGVGKLAELIQEKILVWGGEIKTQTSVVEVIADQNVVKDNNGKSYYYNNMIWAADLKNFYRIVNTGVMPSKLEKNYYTTKTKILANRGGDSVFSLFLSVDVPLQSFREIANGHFFYTPSKQGLGNTHREELDRILKNFDTINKQDIFEWLDRFIGLNTFEISIPGLKDPDLVPEGKTGLIISLLSEYTLFEKIEQAGWLEEFVKAMEDGIIKAISNSVYPILKDKILHRFSFSPLSYANRIASSEGAIVGWEFTSDMPVINKIQIADRSVKTPFPNIFQAGQWAYSPAGVPMSILTGKIATNKIK